MNIFNFSEKHWRLKMVTFHQWDTEPWSAGWKHWWRWWSFRYWRTFGSRQWQRWLLNGRNWNRVPSGKDRNCCLGSLGWPTLIVDWTQWCWISLLDPYKILMTRLQIQNKPVTHRVIDWVLEYFRSMNTKFLSVSPAWGKNYRQWLTNNVDTDNQHTMERQVQAPIIKLWGDSS